MLTSQNKPVRVLFEQRSTLLVFSDRYSTFRDFCDCSEIAGNYGRIINVTKSQDFKGYRNCSYICIAGYLNNPAYNLFRLLDYATKNNLTRICL